MGAIEEVSLAVNEVGLMQGLRHAFTNKHTVFKEMLQNTDRAGATEVSVVVTGVGASLIDISFEDDGCGIENLSILLNVASSGWSEEIMSSRMPYGLGFLSALYVATEIEVESLGKRIAFKTSDALQFKAIPVYASDRASKPRGSRFVLRGVEMSEVEANKYVSELVLGFPIKVLLNGMPTNQGHAVGSPGRKFNQTAIGLISDPGYETGVIDGPLICYLQGFSVYKSYCGWIGNLYGSEGNVTVVHLDSTLFIARMPDRDVLIDEKEQFNKIKGVLDREWLRILDERLSAMDAKLFVDTYWKAICTYNIGLINQFDFLPMQLVQTFNDAPECREENVRTCQVHIDRDDIESKRVRLAIIDSSFESYELSWNYAWFMEMQIVSGVHLPADHWARNSIQELDDEYLEVNIVKEKARGHLDATWVSGPVILCESFEIGGKDVKGNRLDVFSSTSNGIYDGDSFIIPEQETNGDWLVNQAASYMDDGDYFQEDDMESDRKDLQRKILELSGGTDAEIMRSLIDGNVSFFGMTSLKGKTFKVKIHEDGYLESVELI